MKMRPESMPITVAPHRGNAEAIKLIIELSRSKGGTGTDEEILGDVLLAGIDRLLRQENIPVTVTDGDSLQ